MDERLARWRLVPGRGSKQLGNLDPQQQACSDALGHLYDREGQDDGAGVGYGASNLTAPEWINEIHTLLPKRTVRTTEKDALERYGMVELVTDKELLERVKPFEMLLQVILQTKHLMSPDVLQATRQTVRKVVAALVEKMRPRIRCTLMGRRDPNRRSFFKVAANFDLKRTIHVNLKNYLTEIRQLVILKPIFYPRTRRQSEKWQFMVVVNQLGSMAESVIHSTVTAFIFHRFLTLKNHLIAPDTSVVDLTSDIADPIETLMKVQPGGSTDIAQAMRYAESLITEPRRAMVVLITDLYEGGSVHDLVQCVTRTVQGGSKVLILGALTVNGAVFFDRELGRRLAARGARVGAMIPHGLADWVAEVIR